MPDVKTLESMKSMLLTRFSRGINELSALQYNYDARTAAKSIRKKEKQPSPIWVLQRGGLDVDG